MTESFKYHYPKKIKKIKNKQVKKKRSICGFINKFLPV